MVSDAPSLKAPPRFPDANVCSARLQTESKGERAMLAINLGESFWFAFTLVNSGLMVMAAIRLARERNLGTKLALIGAILFLIGGLALRIVWTYYIPFETCTSTISWLAVLNGIAAMLFSIGLLFHALRRPILSARIRQLEKELETRQSGL